MKSLNQNKINKIFVIILIVLVAFIGYSRITEKKRVDYYICYDWFSTGYGMTPEETRDYCNERND